MLLKVQLLLFGSADAKATAELLLASCCAAAQQLAMLSPIQQASSWQILSIFFVLIQMAVSGRQQR
jgi:hypothetical protein